jgi:hypothetical protein
MRIVRLASLVSLIFTTDLTAQTPPPVAIAQRLDTPQARVIVATLQPHAPVNARTGHATDRVLVYLDDGAMTSTVDGRATRIEFHRGDVRGRPARGP